MKKGIYYVPLFLIILFNISVCWYFKEWYCLTSWSISLLLLGECLLFKIYKIIYKSLPILKR
jgi:hypothetical protein